MPVTRGNCRLKDVNPSEAVTLAPPTLLSNTAALGTSWVTPGEDATSTPVRYRSTPTGATVASWPLRSTTGSPPSVLERPLTRLQLPRKPGSAERFGMLDRPA